MSLLTRIYNLKAKYRETSGAINTEQAALGDIMRQRSKAVTKAQGLMGDYKSGRRSFVESYGTQEDVDSYTDDTDINSLSESFYNRKMDEFSKTEGYGAFADYMSFTERMLNKPSGFNSGLLMQQYRERAKQGIADFDRIVMNPYKELTASAEDLSSVFENYESAATEIEGFDSDISASQQRLEGFGASQQEIQGMISSTQRQYGFSVEQRKRGTRGNVQRRTALTSRSSFA